MLEIVLPAINVALTLFSLQQLFTLSMRIQEIQINNADSVTNISNVFRDEVNVVNRELKDTQEELLVSHEDILTKVVQDQWELRSDLQRLDDRFENMQREQHEFQRIVLEYFNRRSQ